MAVPVKEIERLKDFIQSVQNEYWNSDPAEYVRFRRYLGRRILMLQAGELDEHEYIEKWLNKIPNVPGEVL